VRGIRSHLPDVVRRQTDSAAIRFCDQFDVVLSTSTSRSYTRGNFPISFIHSRMQHLTGPRVFEWYSETHDHIQIYPNVSFRGS